MANLPLSKRRCETCKYFEPGDDAERGFCTNVAVAQDKPRVPVRAKLTSCAGQWHGVADRWEARKTGWWPFGR